jgi:hypothetical protein
MKRIIRAVLVGTLAIGGVTGCVSSKRQIDKEDTRSFKIEGTSWYGFCQGRNAFIWVPSKHDSDPDELEAVIYDDYRCVGKIEPSATPTTSGKPDTDPDGIIDDEED